MSLIFYLIQFIIEILRPFEYFITNSHYFDFDFMAIHQDFEEYSNIKDLMAQTMEVRIVPNPPSESSSSSSSSSDSESESQVIEGPESAVPQLPAPIYPYREGFVNMFASLGFLVSVSVKSGYLDWMLPPVVGDFLKGQYGHNIIVGTFWGIGQVVFELLNVFTVLGHQVLGDAVLLADDYKDWLSEERPFSELYEKFVSDFDHYRTSVSFHSLRSKEKVEEYLEMLRHYNAVYNRIDLSLKYGKITIEEASETLRDCRIGCIRARQDLDRFIAVEKKNISLNLEMFRKVMCFNIDQVTKYPMFALESHEGFSEFLEAEKELYSVVNRSRFLCNNIYKGQAPSKEFYDHYLVAHDTALILIDYFLNKEEDLYLMTTNMKSIKTFEQMQRLMELRSFRTNFVSNLTMTDWFLRHNYYLTEFYTKDYSAYGGPYVNSLDPNYFNDSKNFYYYYCNHFYPRSHWSKFMFKDFDLYWKDIWDRWK